MNKKTIIYGLLALFALLRITQCSNISTDRLKTKVPEAELIAQLETDIPLLMEKAMIPGLSIAVVRDGRMIWTKGFGIRSTETKDAVTDETIYEAASLSKPVFAYAVMKLVERGQLDLDKPLMEYADDKYVEETFQRGEIEDERIRKITARMALSHTPGFPNWRSQRQIRINFEPGEKWSYSGEGFVFLQRVVEKITGERLNDFMKKEVFGPLGMTHSSYVWEKFFDDHTAYPHSFMGTALEKRGQTRGVSAASLHTTASDFGRFVMAIMNRQGLSDTTITRMMTSQSVVDPEEGEALTWGLGVGLEKSKHGTAYWHWGDNMNFRCFFLAYPEQKIGVVYFTNSFFGLAVARKIVDLSVGGDHPVFASDLLAGYGDVDDASMGFTRVLVRNGVQAAIESYNQLREELPDQEIVSENFMNQIGYMMLGKDQVDDAIEIFKLNVKAYPDASNVYDSLGEAYMKKGEKELAIKNYEKSVELNPENENGKEKLEELKK